MLTAKVASVPSSQLGPKAPQSLGPSIDPPATDALSVDDSDIVVLNSAIKAFLPSTHYPVLIGAQTLRRAADGDLIVASQTIPPGSQTTIFGVKVFVGSRHLILDDTTHAFSPKTENTIPHKPLGPDLLDGYAAQVVSIETMVVASQLITPDTQFTVSGHVISRDTNDVVLDGVSRSLIPENTGTAISHSISDPASTSSNIAIALPSGTAFIHHDFIITNTASSQSLVPEPTMIPVGTSSHHNLPSIVAAEASVLIAAEELSTAASPSSVHPSSDKIEIATQSMGRASESSPAKDFGSRGRGSVGVWCQVIAVVASAVVAGRFFGESDL